MVVQHLDELEHEFVVQWACICRLFAKADLITTILKYHRVFKSLNNIEAAERSVIGRSNPTLVLLIFMDSKS